MKLITVLRTEYPEFWQFCRTKKIQTSEQLSESIYAVYRKAAGCGEEYTDAVKARIAEAEKASERRVCDVLGLQLLDEYREIPVEDAGFGVRISHIFQQGGERTLYDVMACRESDLRGRKNLGQKSVSEMYDCIENYLASGKAPAAPAEGAPARLQASLYREPVWISLEAEDKEAKEGIRELQKLADSAPAQSFRLCEGLQDFYRPLFAYYRSVRDMLQSCTSLPDYIKGCPAGELTAAYGLRFPKQAEALSAWPKDETVSAILLHAAHEDPWEPADWLAAAKAFCRWLQDMGPAETAEQIFCKDNVESHKGWNCADRYWDIIIRRSAGEKLVAIGSSYGLTRERARQIEKITLKRLSAAYDACAHDLACLMHLRTGGSILTYEQAEGLIGTTNARLLWIMASKRMLDCSLYEYCKDLSALYFNRITGTPADLEKVYAAMQSLPEEFYEDETHVLFAEAAGKQDVPASALEEWLPFARKKYGPLYAVSKPDLTKKCEYLLKYCFKDGYKIGDEKAAEEAGRLLSETFGEDKQTTKRSLENRIPAAGQLVGKGLYMYPAYVQMDYTVLDDVFAYIKKSDSSIIPYQELYSVFRSRLQEAGINNRYALQGAMKRTGCPYMATRDYILKNEAGSMAAELSAFAKAKGRFTAKEFGDAYPYYNANLLYSLVSRTDDVIQIGPGLFMDASRLDYTQKEELDILSFIYRHMGPSGMDTGAVFAEFRMSFAPFCVRNGIEGAGTLFFVLEHMYGDYFTFARPMITAD